MITTPIIQIIPDPVGRHSGVADYARILGDRLQEVAGRTSTLGGTNSLGEVAGADLILHYVNYGYHPRGLPNDLLARLRKWRGANRARLLTIFHETYASGPPWKSAFWLQPAQKRIARSIAQLSDYCIASNEIALTQLLHLVPGLRVEVHPTFSNFGEPTLKPDEITQRDPHRWVIFGRTALITQSLRSFKATLQNIPEEIAPEQLCVFGGEEDDTVRALVARLQSIEVRYRPSIEPHEASGILAQSAFAWIDYFSNRNVAPGVILKSGVFAACCAHAVVPVFPHGGAPFSFNGHSLPGPFFVDHGAHDLPTAAQRADAAVRFYEFYQHVVASRLVAKRIADILRQ